MDQLLGHPARDPHGASIPPKDGEFQEPKYRSLAEVRAGERVVIREVEDDDPERLRYLASLGLRPDVELVVREIAPYSGPITVELADERTSKSQPVVGVELARVIAVEAA
jgi:DtxR family Mn-dependent transcriptional regulator